MISNYIFIKATYGLSTCEVQFMEHLYRQEPANLTLMFLCVTIFQVISVPITATTHV